MREQHRLATLSAFYLCVFCILYLHLFPFCTLHFVFFTCILHLFFVFLIQYFCTSYFFSILYSVFCVLYFLFFVFYAQLLKAYKQLVEEQHRLATLSALALCLSSLPKYIVRRPLESFKMISSYPHISFIYLHIKLWHFEQFREAPR